MRRIRTEWAAWSQQRCRLHTAHSLAAQFAGCSSSTASSGARAERVSNQRGISISISISKTEQKYVWVWREAETEADEDEEEEEQSRRPSVLFCWGARALSRGAWTCRRPAPARARVAAAASRARSPPMHMHTKAHDMTRHTSQRTSLFYSDHQWNSGTVCITERVSVRAIRSASTMADADGKSAGKRRLPKYSYVKTKNWEQRSAWCRAAMTQISNGAAALSLSLSNFINYSLVIACQLVNLLPQIDSEVRTTLVRVVNRVYIVRSFRVRV